MLLQITNKCAMGCSHCLMNSTIDGSHMDFQMIGQSIQFIKELNPAMLLITGGEPTSHPNFLEIYDECVKIMGGDDDRLMVLSNGMFAEDENLTKEILKRKMNVQVTNDDRYYPKRIKKITSSNIYYFDRIDSIIHVGRAKTNGIPGTKQAPSCFNLLSVIKSGYATNLREANEIMEGKGKVCSLAIEYNGDIRIGETVECHRVGNISKDTIHSTFNNAKKLNSKSCNNCGLMDKLSDVYKIAIDK